MALTKYASDLIQAEIAKLPHSSTYWEVPIPGCNCEWCTWMRHRTCDRCGHDLGSNPTGCRNCSIVVMTGQLWQKR